MRIAIAIIVAGLLASCAPRDYSAYDHEYCINIGAQYASPAYVQCRTSAASIREQRRANLLGVIMLQNQQRQMHQQQYKTLNCYHTGTTTTCQ